MNENQKVFAEALRLFVNNKLMNDIGWESFADIATSDSERYRMGIFRGYSYK